MILLASLAVTECGVVVFIIYQEGNHVTGLPNIHISDGVTGIGLPGTAAFVRSRFRKVTPARRSMRFKIYTSLMLRCMTVPSGTGN